MKTKKDLKSTYLTFGNWSSKIVDFLKNTSGDYLEIGSYWGVLIAEIGIDFPNKQLYSIDPFISDGWTGQIRGTNLSDIEDVFQHNIKDLNITHFKSTSKEFLDRGDFSQISNVSCMLIDGSHHYEDILADIEIFKRIDNNYAKYLVFDDLHIPDVAAAVNYFRETFKDRVSSEREPGQFKLDEM
tara:strand:- start:1934 stop:2488 length:555 start_codon:yes stop_codon:yes gene_type:complete